MITDRALEFECMKHVELTNASNPPSGESAKFMRYYLEAYLRLLPNSVLYEDVRDSAHDMFYARMQHPSVDKDLPWIAAHLVLLKAGLANRPFRFVEDTQQIVDHIFDALKDKVDDELVASMESLIGEKYVGVGALAHDHRRRAANMLVCVRFYLRLVLEERDTSETGSMLAVTLAAVSPTDGADVVKYLTKEASG